MTKTRKLSDDDVAFIRKRLKRESAIDLAVEYNVHPSTISLIRNGKRRMEGKK